MRVAFDKEDARLLPIRRRVELEEDQIVGREEEHDLLISRRDLGQSDVPVFGVTTALPVEALGYSLTSEKEYDFFLTKVFDGGWGEEVYVGIPVKGLMNEDCGVGVNSAVWVAGVAEDSTDRFNFERLNEFFMPPMLVDTLVHMNYAGFVSILVNSADSSLRVFGVQTGMPRLGFYAIAENIRGKISEFGVSPSQVVVRRSWGLASMFSRYPFPFKEVAADVPLEGLSPAVEKHFWVGKGRRYKGQFYTKETLLGVVSAWGIHPSESESRVLRTCRALAVPFKQYRTDLSSSLWRKLETLGLGEPAHRLSDVA